ncbi:hypothetical protein P9H32_15305 [Pontiella sp. NLcol2]|uniref:Uncharacterized protein n=1 Tax=Pontiella agarivorans TaxID=3038953 RepID=A0ABU5N0M1_9BACT|nr:hypothetical protein [Pontiella agarivorans]
MVMVIPPKYSIVEVVEHLTANRRRFCGRNLNGSQRCVGKNMLHWFPGTSSAVWVLMKKQSFGMSNTGDGRIQMGL